MLYLIIICLLLFLWFKFFKVPKFGNLILVTGGVKSGKTLLSLYLAIKRYKSILFKTKVVNFFRKIFKKSLIDLPLFYSSIPVGIDYVPIDKDILTLKKRVIWNSVMFVDEASLFADSQLKENSSTNNNLLLFNKLCAHFGLACLVYNTQCIGDVHYSIKRSLSNYFYVHHSRKCLLLPFVILYVQEFRYSDDGSVVSVSGVKDLEETLKRVIIPKSIFKKYDSRCYRKIIEDLQPSYKVVKMFKNSKLTCDEIISFRPEFNQLVKKIKNVSDVKKIELKGVDKNAKN